MAALRLICAAPTINPAVGCLCPTFPSLLNHRVLDYHRALCTRLAHTVIPLSRRTHHPLAPLKVRSYLPVDELANLAHPTLGSFSLAPLADAFPLSDRATLPPHDTMTNVYRARNGRTRLLLLKEWRGLGLPPLYSTLLLSLTLHPFMGLRIFIAGRIHQMRAHKRYLTTHTSWSKLDEPRQCPRCCEEEETFSHAILRCRSTSYHREHLLSGLSSVGPRLHYGALFPRSEDKIT